MEFAVGDISALGIRLITALQLQPRIQSARLGGSAGRGTLASGSDIDLFLTTFRAHRESVVETLQEVLRSAEFFPRFSRGPVFIEGFGWSLTFYDPSQPIVQVNLVDEEELKPHFMQKGSAPPLFDRTGNATRAIAAASSMQFSKESILRDALTLGFLRVLAARKEITRGNALQASKYLVEVVECAVRIRWIREGSDPPGRNYREPLRGIESALPVAFVVRAEAAMSGSGPTQIMGACVRLYVEEVLATQSREITAIHILECLRGENII